MLAQTSLIAFHRNPEIRQTIKAKVLHALGKFHGKTAYEVSTELDLPITSVRPRLTDLFKEGLVVEVGKRFCPIASQDCIIYRKKNEY